MGVPMARDSNDRYGGWIALAAIALLMLLPTIVAEAHGVGVPPFSSSPDPALDRLLGSVARTVPLDGRVLVAGDPAVLVFERAVSSLYPRHVFTALSADYTQVHHTHTLRWSEVRALAHQYRARYILLWQVPLSIPPTVHVRVRSARGMLLDLPP
jgi:hypothetical protein